MQSIKQGPQPDADLGVGPGMGFNLTTRRLNMPELLLAQLSIFSWTTHDLEHKCWDQGPQPQSQVLTLTDNHCMCFSANPPWCMKRRCTGARLILIRSLLAFFWIVRGFAIVMPESIQCSDLRMKKKTFWRSSISGTGYWCSREDHKMLLKVLSSQTNCPCVTVHWLPGSFKARGQRGNTAV